MPSLAVLANGTMRVAMPVRFAPGHYPAQVTCAYTLRDALLAETAYDPGARLGRHLHERACWVIVVAGAFREDYEGGTRECRAPSVIFRPAGELHDDVFGRDGGRCLNVELIPGSALVEHEPPITRSVDFVGAEVTRLAGKLYREFCDRDALFTLAIEGLLLELTAASARGLASCADRQRPRWLEQARELMEANFSEVLRAQDIAREVGVHPVRLVRSFRRFIGCSVADYLRQRRVAFAAERLKSTDESIANIALSAGFCDQSHFGKTFRKLTGVTPAAYRALQRCRAAPTKASRSYKTDFPEPD